MKIKFVDKDLIGYKELGKDSCKYVQTEFIKTGLSLIYLRIKGGVAVIVHYCSLPLIDRRAC